jgi:Sigma-70, region 4
MRIVVSLLTAAVTALAVPAAAPGQLPSLPDPPELPQLPAPLPQLPKLPSAPSAPVPVPNPPPLPAPKLPSAPAGDPAPAPASRPAPAPAAGPAPAPASGPSSSVASAPGGGGDTSGGTVRPGTPTGRGTSPSHASARHRRADRRLRRTVRRLDACLDDLSSGERRVLTLRAGAGPAAPHSRRAAARALDMSVGRVRRLERGGLRRARALARTGACGASPAGAASPSGATSPAAPGAVPLLRPTMADQPAPATVREDDTAAAPARGEGAVLGESVTRMPGPLPGDREMRIPWPKRAGERSVGTPIGIGIALILLAALAGYATPHLQERLYPS